MRSNKISFVAGAAAGVASLIAYFESQTRSSCTEHEAEVPGLTPEQISQVADMQQVLVELANKQRLDLIKAGFDEVMAQQMAAASYVSMLNLPR